ncbi:hypothetical protein [Microbacterium sp. B35-04]|uniref:hypothetical protein n=1 Tax=Microbacterium sp. B35-04 TaxID=1961716 RepID=UPI001EF95BFF|nr:hypothetical protein [Microbacterium sp. B35-04]
MRTRVTAAALGALMMLTLAGCTTPEPMDPTPTPTSAFASEEEAFAAAEATYRAYAAAENARREDPNAPDPQLFLTGSALENHIDSQRRFDELGVHLVGDSVVTAFDGQSTSSDLRRVIAVVCLDSSAARLLDSAGNVVTPEDRDATLALEASLKFVGDAFLITDSEIAGDSSC